MSFRLNALAVALVAAAKSAVAAPCDIYGQAGTPCIAAHGMTRALYDAYSGPLYQVQRDSDGGSTFVTPLAPGGVANATIQDEFCRGTTCVISIIYDQSGHNNHLFQAPKGGAAQGPEANGYDSLASAIGAPVTLNGKKAYGVFSAPGHGYRNNHANGTAVNDEAQGMYAIFDGTHFNKGCCFDYGNAETSGLDTGDGHMETIYFGLGDGSNNIGGGNGPWIMADLENGLFSGQNPGVHTADPSQTSRFVTAIVKGEPGHWAIRGGNAASGGLSSYYDGARPNHNPNYNPMKKEGAIILGIGGDNSNWAQGTFYEGVMTKGYPTDDTENKVQSNIVAARYGAAALNSGPSLNIGSSVSFRVTTPGYTDRYLTHDGSSNSVGTEVVNGSSDGGLKQRASFTVRTGLGNNACYSFESRDKPGSFLRHSNFEIKLDGNDGSKLFSEDATWCSSPGINGQGNSFRSWSFPTRYFRHYTAKLYAARNGGYKEFDLQGSFNDDVSWAMSAGFA